MKIDKETIEAQTNMLCKCPFCGGKAEFYVSKNEKAPLHIRHIPESGVNCPARYDQYCEHYDDGRLWWNGRSLVNA